VHPQRILLVSNGLQLGGAEQQLAELAIRLHRRGWLVEVVSLRPGGAFLEKLEQSSIRVHQLDWHPRRPHRFLRLAGIVREFRPQIVHAHLAYANLAARLCRPFCPMPVLICTAHSVYEHTRKLDLRGNILDLLYRHTDGLCDLTTIVCEAGARRYVKDRLVAAERIRVVYNGVDFSKFHNRSDSAEEKFRWISVGRLSSVKDYPTMLRAFALSLQMSERPQALKIVGGGDQAEALVRLAGQLNLMEHVEFLGSRTDIPELLADSDALLQSSEWEGFPIVLLEAAAASLPVVVTDVGGNREIVVEGKTGFLTPPGDSAALAQRMQQLLELPDSQRRELGSAARSRALEQFSIDKILDQWEEIYATMLDSQGRSVRSYFDRIADSYKSRYASQDPYYRYFFYERLREALNGERGLQGKILDIGAGTGPLYDQLQVASPEAEYFGTDISPEMLERSNIPATQRAVGEFPQITQELAPFDRIYCLGVTTYLDQPGVHRLLQGLADQLKSGGTAAVTFTNRGSIDFWTRAVLYRLMRLPGIRYFSRNRVAGQKFSYYEASSRQVIKALPQGLKVDEIVYLNHTVMPLNRIFPRISVAVATRLHKWLGRSSALGFLSTDFLVRLRKL
jgi:glycosyltransferase involved in cell wall biosynthesis/SAM-dependent methyltransferase